MFHVASINMTRLHNAASIVYLLRARWLVLQRLVSIRASNEASRRLHEDFTITEKASTRAFWLKALTSALTFKTLFQSYVKWELTQSK